VIFEEAKTEAKAKQIDKPHTIIGSDLDPEIIAKAKANAKNAGLADDAITFEVKDCKEYMSTL
jgi:23S rRNA G2445 N2-methylase RlmL